MNTALEIQNDNRQIDEAPALSVATMNPMQMAYQLISSGADFASVKEMMALSKELAADQARRAFDEAVAAAKAEIPTISKNAKGHNDKRYANFAAYAKVVDPLIAQHGLSYRFRTEQTDRITVTCVLSHKGGHSEENSLSGPPDNSGSKNAIQAIGSTLTYLQRYTLIQALGLAASDDDDGRSHGKDEQDLAKITEAQASVIRELMEKAELSADQFCQHYKIESVPDLPAGNFNAAVASLRKRIAIVSEKGQNNG
jgi:hypothetical protein